MQIPRWVRIPDIFLISPPCRSANKGQVGKERSPGSLRVVWVEEIAAEGVCWQRAILCRPRQQLTAGYSGVGVEEGKCMCPPALLTLGAAGWRVPWWHLDTSLSHPGGASPPHPQPPLAAGSGSSVQSPAGVCLRLEKRWTGQTDLHF